MYSQENYLKTNNNVIELDISFLKCGLYNVIIKDENNYFAVSRFIKSY
jgi:hypothetical protein